MSTHDYLKRLYPKEPFEKVSSLEGEDRVKEEEKMFLFGELSD